MTLRYYFWATHRRKALDRLQEKHKGVYRGRVLDVGGRDRGSFNKPKNLVHEWIFADIAEEHNPDLVLDVSNMHQIKDGTVDVVNAIELFEHVERIEEGLDECARVLKEDGTLVISCPFLYPLHGDPYDYQRWTEHRWRRELEVRGLYVQQLTVTGRFFSVQADMCRALIKSLPRFFRYCAMILFPLIDAFVILDRYVVKGSRLGAYHSGYFIIAGKDDGNRD